MRVERVQLHRMVEGAELRGDGASVEVDGRRCIERRGAIDMMSRRLVAREVADVHIGSGPGPAGGGVAPGAECQNKVSTALYMERNERKNGRSFYQVRPFQISRMAFGVTP